MRVGLRLSDVKLALLGESDSPVATLIKSGALDLVEAWEPFEVLATKAARPSSKPRATAWSSTS